MPNADFMKLVGKHTGETGIVVGNGPSLNAVPVEFLNKYPSFGTNLIYLHESFVPTYYIAVDPSNVRGDYYERVNALPSIKIIGHKLAKNIPGCIWLQTNSAQQKFQKTPFSNPIWEGYSVTYVVLQVAYRMGFKTILLVGVDHRYHGKGNDHFHPDYEVGWNWVEHDMTKSIPAYQLAYRYYTVEGRRIINLTPGSDLHVFEKGELSEWL